MQNKLSSESARLLLQKINTQFLVLQVAEDFSIIDFNINAKQFFSWNESHYNQNLFQTCEDSGIELPYEDLKIILLQKISKNFNAAYNDLKGNKYILHWHIFPIEDQQRLYLFMMADDITTHEKNKIESEKNAIYLQNIINHVPHFIFWKDTNSRFLGCNEIFAKSAGFNSPDEIIGKSDFDMPWGKTEAQSYINDDKETVATGIAKINIEEPQRTLTGNQMVLLTSKVPLYNRAKEIIGILGIYSDITERKKMEQELLLAKKQAESYLQNAVEQIPGEIYWKNKEGVYLGCNSRFAKHLGCSGIEGVIGKTDVELGFEKHSQKSTYSDNGDSKPRNEEEFEEVRQLPDGKKCIYLTKKSVLRDKEKKLLGVIAISFDITEHRQAEEERAKTLQSFGSIIAHEMRTPLASINAGLRGVGLNLAELTDIESLSGSKKRAYNNINEILESIAFEIESSGLVIDMVLENIKVSQSDQIPLKEISINRCVEETLSRYPIADKHKGLITFRKGEDFIFLGEKHLFTHVLFNLIKNALYFIDSAGKGSITIWTEKMDTMNYLHFKDTGTGIEDDVLPNIFKKFYSRRYHGVGLGLAFCKQIMQKFGGDIVCRSAPREYTEFILSFPL